MNEGHDWLLLYDDGGTRSIRWCRRCGVVKDEMLGNRRVYAPRIAEGVSRTKCARKGDEDAAGRTPVRPAPTDLG